MILSRRKLIAGAGLLFVAPAIVRAESLMKVRSLTHLEGESVQMLAPIGGRIFAVRVSAPNIAWHTLNPPPLTFRSGVRQIFIPDDFMPHAPIRERILAAAAQASGEIPTAAGESAA